MKIGILIGLFICHFLADYTHLSTAWMLNAKKLGKPFLPILVHASVHGLLMFIFMNFIGTPMLLNILLTLFQIISHACIDLLKGRLNGWFPLLQESSNKWHWIVFGADQLSHSIVIVIMYSCLI